MTLQTDLEQAIAKVQADSTLLHDIVQGDATTTVSTENGTVKSIAKMEADIQADLDANTVITQVTTLLNESETARDAAQLAATDAQTAAASVAPEFHGFRLLDDRSLEWVHVTDGSFNVVDFDDTAIWPPGVTAEINANGELEVCI